MEHRLVKIAKGASGNGWWRLAYCSCGWNSQSCHSVLQAFTQYDERQKLRSLGRGARTAATNANGQLADDLGAEREATNLQENMI
jgi:hypothetical protein